MLLYHLVDYLLFLVSYVVQHIAEEDKGKQDVLGGIGEGDDGVHLEQLVALEGAGGFNEGEALAQELLG